ncbi:MAG: hypothetical protein HFH09_01705 [Bacilli bacterium]|jgi:hypothetical protein|nr:hypothetical protein [Bacilli bacterium]
MKKIDNTTVIDIQLIGTLLSILSFSFAFILLYNQKLLEENKKPLFSKQDTLNYVALNRLFVLAIVFLFLGANALHLKIDKEKGEDLTFDYLDILSSVLTLVVALLAIYMAYKALKDSDLSIDSSIDDALL